MTRSHRLAVLILPAVNDFAWRQAIKAAADARGWGVHENWGDETPALDPDRNTVIVTIDPDAAARFQPTDWVILTTSREEALAQSIAQYGLSDIAARIHSTSRFASADRLAARGAAVFDVYSSRIELPGFGEVVLPADGVARRLPADIVMAPQFIAQAGSQGWETELDLALFARPGVRRADATADDVDLTGRARVVVVGPGLDLPPGVWGIWLKFAVDNEGALPTLLFEWGSGIDMVKYETTIRQPGVYEISLEAAWLTTATSHLLVSVTRPLFSGALRIVEARLKRVAEAATPEPSATEIHVVGSEDGSRPSVG